MQPQTNSINNPIESEVFFPDDLEDENTPKQDNKMMFASLLKENSVDSTLRLTKFNNETPFED